MTRFRLVVAVTVAWSMVLTGVAVAGELEDMLRRAATAEFTGQQVVVTYDGGETTAGFYEVTQSAGFVYVKAGSDQAMMGEGKVASADQQREGHVQVADWMSWRLSDRYSLGEITRSVRLGRPASLVTILDGGIVRSRMAFDIATGAPMLSEVYDGSGDLYRLAIVTEFDPIVLATDMPNAPGESNGYEMMMPKTSFRLPESAGGYWRADTYEGPDATLHAFYTDGLFSFSVFELDPRADAGKLDEGRLVSLGDNAYRRLVDPGGVWLFWRAPDHAYLLVGDLPPDHLEAVVADLPEPGRANLFKRIWRGLFG
ncbi:MAG: hypothetical protein R3246_13820 [Acidimicrobiia bacterium]|nr:hypothetical protein [Acidimicrobiia bacterium]